MSVARIILIIFGILFLGGSCHYYNKRIEKDRREVLKKIVDASVKEDEPGFYSLLDTSNMFKFLSKESVRFLMDELGRIAVACNPEFDNIKVIPDSTLNNTVTFYLLPLCRDSIYLKVDFFNLSKPTKILGLEIKYKHPRFFKDSMNISPPIVTPIGEN